MTEPSTSAPSLLVLIATTTGVSEPLEIALEGIGADPVQVSRTGDARKVIQGAPGLVAVMSEVCLIWCRTRRY